MLLGDQTSFAFMLPIATPPNAIAFSGGDLVVMDMARPGIVANLIGIVLTSTCSYTLGGLVFGMMGDAPDWATIDSDTNSTEC